MLTELLVLSRAPFAGAVIEKSQAGVGVGVEVGVGAGLGVGLGGGKGAALIFTWSPGLRTIGGRVAALTRLATNNVTKTTSHQTFFI